MTEKLGPVAVATTTPLVPPQWIVIGASAVNSAPEMPSGEPAVPDEADRLIVAWPPHAHARLAPPSPSPSAPVSSRAVLRRSLMSVTSECGAKWQAEFTAGTAFQQ